MDKIIKYEDLKTDYDDYADVQLSYQDIISYFSESNDKTLEFRCPKCGSEMYLGFRFYDKMYYKAECECGYAVKTPVMSFEDFLKTRKDK